MTVTADKAVAPFDRLLSAISERDASVSLCHITRHGQSAVMSLSVAGHWGALGRIETAMPALADQLGLKVQLFRTQAEAPKRPFRPYAVELYAPQQAELPPAFIEFFLSQDVEIRDLSASTYRSGISGGDLMNLSLILDVPLDIAPHTLREGFMDLCDDMRADGVLDPIKS